jgi:hypothetical protein
MERPHKTDHRLPDCRGIIKYLNSAAASRAMKALSRRTNARPHRNIKPYHCSNCGGWHLGTRGEPNLRKERRDAGRHSFA